MPLPCLGVTIAAGRRMLFMQACSTPHLATCLYILGRVVRGGGWRNTAGGADAVLAAVYRVPATKRGLRWWRMYSAPGWKTGESISNVLFWKVRQYSFCWRDSGWWTCLFWDAPSHAPPFSLDAPHSACRFILSSARCHLCVPPFTVRGTAAALRPARGHALTGLYACGWRHYHLHGRAASTRTLSFPFTAVCCWACLLCCKRCSIYLSFAFLRVSSQTSFYGWRWRTPRTAFAAWVRRRRWKGCLWLPIYLPVYCWVRAFCAHTVQWGHYLPSPGGGRSPLPGVGRRPQVVFVTFPGYLPFPQPCMLPPPHHLPALTPQAFSLLWDGRILLRWRGSVPTYFCLRYGCDMPPRDGLRLHLCAARANATTCTFGLGCLLPAACICHAVSRCVHTTMYAALGSRPIAVDGGTRAFLRGWNGGCLRGQIVGGSPGILAGRRGGRHGRRAGVPLVRASFLMPHTHFSCSCAFFLPTASCVPFSTSADVQALLQDGEVPLPLPCLYCWHATLLHCSLCCHKWEVCCRVAHCPLLLPAHTPCPTQHTPPHYIFLYLL